MAFQSLSYKKRSIVVDLTESVTINNADAVSAPLIISAIFMKLLMCIVRKPLKVKSLCTSRFALLKGDCS
jgi:hypothetical protein